MTTIWKKSLSLICSANPWKFWQDESSDGLHQENKALPQKWETIQGIFE